MKRIVALALCLVMVLGLMAGCQKSMDAKTLAQKMEEAMKAITAQGGDVEMGLEMKLSTMGVTMTISMDMAMKVLAKADFSSIYYDMNLTMNALGESEETKVEAYGTMEDGSMVYYAYDSAEDMWVKTVQDSFGEMVEQFKGIEFKFNEMPAESLFLAKVPETVNDRKCYVLTAQLDGATIQEQLGDYMDTLLSQMSGTEELDEESMAQLEAVLKGLDWTMLSGKCVYYVDMETFLPVEMVMEIDGLGDVFNSMIGTLITEMAALLEGEEIPEFSVEIPTIQIVTKNMIYNEAVEVPAVPQEAIDNAIDADALMEEPVDDELNDYEHLANEPQADGSYLMPLGSSTVKVMVPEGYGVYMTDVEYIACMTEDMMNSLDYMVLTDLTAEEQAASVMENVTWAQEEGYYKSHTEVEELNGFMTMSLVYNDNTSLWYAWKELDGDVLVMGALVEGETFDLAGLIATVEIIAE